MSDEKKYKPNPQVAKAATRMAIPATNQNSASNG